jgi:hypothetical protein
MCERRSGDSLPSPIDWLNVSNGSSKVEESLRGCCQRERPRPGNA